MRSFLVVLLALLFSFDVFSKTLANTPELLLSEYMKAKSSNNVEALKAFFPKITKNDFQYFSKPKNYQILKKLKVGKDLKVIPGFRKEDIILKVQELNPNEIIFYTFRQDNKKWQLIDFAVDSAFWEHSF